MTQPWEIILSKQAETTTIGGSIFSFIVAYFKFRKTSNYKAIVFLSHQRIEYGGNFDTPWSKVPYIWFGKLLEVSANEAVEENQEQKVTNNPSLLRYLLDFAVTIARAVPSWT